MPYAVTHILVTIIIADLIWHFFIKHKNYKLHFIFLAGFFGILPDIDYIIYYLFNPLAGIAMNEVHRLYSHSFIWVFAILFLSLFFHKKLFFYFCALGFSLHLILDGLLVGDIYPLSPFINYKFGLNLLSGTYGNYVLMGIDAVILILWLYHEYKAKEIKDFI